MYNIRQFKPALYLLLLLGVGGYALALESVGMLAPGWSAILLNGWLVRTGRFVPMPRLLANAVTLLALLFAARQVMAGAHNPVLSIGQFLVLLQIIKLWEQRANRDYAQLLVLSLLLMVAAMINTASLLFGVLLIVYLFLSLYCCLLLHLKVESDAARATFALPEEKVSPLTLRQDQRYLPRSMRKLTGFVSTVAITMAVLVFLLFPRGTGSGMLAPLQFQPAQTLTGFSDEVSFQNVARITQNTDRVAYVHVWRDDKKVTGSQTLLLRGNMMDVYNRADGPGGRAGKWERSLSNPVSEALDRDQTWRLEKDQRGEKWKQQISLSPTGTNTLFAIAGPTRFTARSEMKVKYFKRDGALQSIEVLNRQVEYEVISRNRLDPPAPAEVDALMERAQTQSQPIDERIRAYARRPDVSGTDANGSLAEQRLAGARSDAMDDAIASNIERHLRSTFAYTLDLTDAKRIHGQDPMVAFLYDLKRGHCEYFAGAMTLMCQSLGMPARLVIGFKCDEYNDVGGYYIVRQSHAHAWVEVLTHHGWKTYDPTSGQDADVVQHAGMWQRVRHLFDFLEYTYANSVIAYDSENRENLIQNVETRMTNAAIRSGPSAEWIKKWKNSSSFWNLSTNALGGFVALMGLAALLLVGRFLWETWRLRRRAARIGLESLPVSDQMRLVRQLGFFDDLMQLLGRYNLERPRHMTPLEFTNSLMFLPSDAYGTVRRLTEIFYRVRYGRAELSPGQQRRLAATISGLDHRFAGSRLRRA